MRGIKINSANKNLIIPVIIIIIILSIILAQKIITQQGKEIIDNVVIIREVDKQLVVDKIEDSKQYLFRVLDKDYGGVHKYYYALDDTFENRLHTIYTASTTLTLLKIYDFKPDNETWKYISNAADFILFMQNKDPTSPAYGAFHYSYYLDHLEKEQKFVVGTTSKTIFTLLELYQKTKDEKYLEAAKLGADWLTTMLNTDGSVKIHIEYQDGQENYLIKKSHLYNGQVLSALSRMYVITKNEKYYNSAEKIANHLLNEISEQGCWLGDEFRNPNAVSSSWAILSLLDFYKTKKDNKIKNIVFQCSDELLEKQKNDPDDILNYGRWQGSMTSSGNGWLNEVYTEIYAFCKQENKQDCKKYKDAIIKATRFVIQHTYSKDNNFITQNPKIALGGIFWSYKDRYVRTDSVCHGVNAYVNIINDLDDGILISVPK